MVTQMLRDERHAACDLFPMLDADAFSALVEDIRANGQKVPIIRFDGKVVDGRNRLKACRELGIEPMFVDLDAEDVGDPYAYVMSLNFHRRHMRPHEKGAALKAYMERVGAKKQPKAGRPKKSATVADSPSLAAVAEKLGVPEATARFHLKAAADYSAAAPEFKAKVDAGEMTPKQARQKTEKNERDTSTGACQEPVDSDRELMQSLCDRFFERATAMVEKNARLRSRLVSNLNIYLQRLSV